MTLKALKFRPGVNRENTTLTNEGTWFESDKVRFRSGSPEKIGGWEKDSGVQETGLTPVIGSYWGVARSLWNWANLSSYNLLAVGTNLKYYIQNTVGGAFNDVTPLRETTAAGEATFAAVDGSNIITVTDTGSTTQAGDFVTFSGALTLSGGLSTGTIAGTSTGSATFTAVVQASTSGDGYDAEFTITSDGAGAYTLDAVTNAGNAYAVSDTIVIAGADLGGSTPANNATITVTAVNSGNITAAVLNKEHQVATVTSSSVYTIVVGVNATANDTGNGGASTVAEYQITTGSDIYTVGVGWGAGGWSGITGTNPTTGWGVAAPVGVGLGVQLRTWSQSNWGEDLVLNDRGGAIYYWKNNANPTIFDRAVVLSPSSPVPFETDAYCPEVCNFVQVTDQSRFVVAYGVNDPDATDPNQQDPMLIRWSGQNDYAVWDPIDGATTQAGFFRLTRGSEIVCAQQTRQEVLVFTDAAVYSQQYQGLPFVFNFQLMADNTSIAGPNAVATAHDVTYWMGVDKFYVYNGRVQTLPSTLRTYVFQNINLDQQYQITAGINDAFSEVWWFYCSANSTTVDRYVVYNYLDNVWHYGTMSRTAWIDAPLRQFPVAAGYANVIFVASISGTTLTVSTVSAGNLSVGMQVVIDGVPQNITITALGTGTGGAGTYTLNFSGTIASQSMQGFYSTPCGEILYHEVGNDDGSTNPPSAIECFVQSADFNLEDGDSFGYVWRIIPDLTFDGSNAPFPTAQFSIRPRQFPGTAYGPAESPNVQSANNYATQRTYNVQQFTPQVNVRIRGRQMALRVGSNTTGVNWQLGTPTADIKPSGRR
jgi:hypothetical protein